MTHRHPGAAELAPQPPISHRQPVPPALSAVRAAAGRSGAAARWRDVPRTPPTVQLRIYADDAAILKSMPGSVADAVHSLLTAHAQI